MRQKEDNAESECYCFLFLFLVLGIDPRISHMVGILPLSYDPCPGWLLTEAKNLE